MLNIYFLSVSFKVQQFHLSATETEELLTENIYTRPLYNRIKNDAAKEWAKALLAEEATQDIEEVQIIGHKANPFKENALKIKEEKESDNDEDDLMLSKIELENRQIFVSQKYSLIYV